MKKRTQYRVRNWATYNAALVNRGNLTLWNVIFLWDVDKKAKPQRLLGHSYWVRSIAFSPDSKILASGSEDKTVILWDVKTGEQRQRLRHSSWGRAVAFHPDGKMLASGGGDKVVTLWEGTEVNENVNIWDQERLAHWIRIACRRAN